MFAFFGFILYLEAVFVIFISNYLLKTTPSEVNMKNNSKTLITASLMIMINAMAAASPPIITKSFTGGWYDPAKNGQGFLLEIINTNQQKKALTTWFTFDMSGQQLWLIGIGEISNQNIHFDMVIPEGGQFGELHDPNNINNTAWGTVTFTFNDCNSGQVTWQPQVGGFDAGSMPVVRSTAIHNLNCTGGLFDELADTVVETETRSPLNSTGVDADASGHVKYEQRTDRIEFSVEIEDVPVGAYELWVANDQKGTINVINVPGGTEGEIEFRDPVEPGKVLLDFDPRGQSIDIIRHGITYLSSDEFNGSNGDNGSSTEAPPFGDSRTELLFNNLGIHPLGYATAELRQRDDRVDFKVELEDVPVGFYDFTVDGDIQGIIEVVATPLGVQGELEFRNPVEPGKELLDFNPINSWLEISQGATAMFNLEFQLGTNGCNQAGNNGCDDDNNGNQDDCDDDSGNDDCDNNPGSNGDDDGGNGGNPSGCLTSVCQGVSPFEIEVQLNNAGLDPDASGEIDYRVRTDRADLKVEVEDLENGTYQLYVGGQLITDFVVSGVETELEFRNPVEPGKLNLNFDPMNQLFEIKRNAAVYLSATLQ